MTSRFDVNDAIYRFGPFQLSPALSSLTRDGRRISLGHRALEVLATLAERAGSLVSKAEIVARVWPNTIVDEGNLRVHIAALRKALGETEERTPYILNVPGRGYRLAVPVQRLEAQADLNLDVDIAPTVTRMHTVEQATLVDDIKSLLNDERLMSMVSKSGGKASFAIALVHQTGLDYRDVWLFAGITSVGDASRFELSPASGEQRTTQVSEAMSETVTSRFRGSETVEDPDSCDRSGLGDSQGKTNLSKCVEHSCAGDEL
ncbi:winged helix-turn-helix domain-containing protein [Paraburkholderia terrae]|nr:transcriptional regulator [Paraburkholderia terrae]